MTRPAAALIAIALVSPPVRWATFDAPASPRPGGREPAPAAIEGRSLSLLREARVQDRLGLTVRQKVEIGRHLELALDPDQEDLVRLILAQYRADRDRL